MEKFNQVIAENLEKLEQFVPIVARVHGESHPEFYDVKEQFDVLNGKIKSKNKDLDLNQEFKALRDITNHYTVPSDVCETYEAVYVMLKALDQAYQD